MPNCVALSRATPRFCPPALLSAATTTREGKHGVGENVRVYGENADKKTGRAQRGDLNNQPNAEACVAEIESEVAWPFIHLCVCVCGDSLYLEPLAYARTGVLQVGEVERGTPPHPERLCREFSHQFLHFLKVGMTQPLHRCERACMWC